MMNTKPRIAILGDFPIGNVSDAYKSRNSFYPSWLYMLHKSFIQNDSFELHWIVVDKIIKKENQFTIANQTFHVLPGSSLTIGLYSAYAYNRWQVARCVRKIKPDLFHGWGTERFYGLCAKDFKGKSLLSVQGLLKAYMQRGKVSSFERKHSVYEKGVLKNVDYISTESLWARDRVLEIAPNARISICEYAVEPIFFSIKRALSDEPSCLISCSNAAIKNTELAISAFSSPELSHIKLYLAGASSDRYNDLPPNIIPLGRLNREELAEQLSKTWCLVHPSLADTGPTSVKEARVAGVSVILTTDCGAKQYVKHGRSGYIVTPNNKQELIDAVISITKTKTTAEQMGTYDVDRCRKELSTSTMHDTFSNLYKTILS